MYQTHCKNIGINYQPELVRDFFNQDGTKTKHACDKQIRDDLVALKPETVESYVTILESFYKPNDIYVEYPIDYSLLILPTGEASCPPTASFSCESLTSME